MDSLSWRPKTCPTAAVSSKLILWLSFKPITSVNESPNSNSSASCQNSHRQLCLHSLPESLSTCISDHQIPLHITSFADGASNHLQRPGEIPAERHFLLPFSRNDHPLAQYTLSALRLKTPHPHPSLINVMPKAFTVVATISKSRGLHFGEKEERKRTPRKTIASAIRHRFYLSMGILLVSLKVEECF